MHPRDLHDEQQRRERVRRRKLAADVRQAALNATPAELLGLQHLTEDVQAGALPLSEAHQHVARLRDEQRDRRTLEA